MMAVRALVSIAALPAVAALVLTWLVVREDSSLSGVAWVGTITVAFGLALFGWCVVIFASRGRATLAPWDPPRRFVATGAYRVVRNPMYLGVGSVILGEAIAFGSWALAGYLLTLAAAWHLFVVLYEEPTLEREFGAEYRRHRSRVPRWLPRVLTLARQP